MGVSPLRDRAGVGDQGQQVAVVVQLLEVIQAGLDVVQRAAIGERGGIDGLGGLIRGARIASQRNLALVLRDRANP